MTSTSVTRRAPPGRLQVQRPQELLARLQLRVELAGESIPVIVFSALQVSQVTARNVKATLLKSSTSNEELASTIRSLLERRFPAPAHS